MARNAPSVRSAVAPVGHLVVADADTSELFRDVLTNAVAADVRSCGGNSFQFYRRREFSGLPKMKIRCKAVAGKCSSNCARRFHVATRQMLYPRERVERVRHERLAPVRAQSLSMRKRPATFTGSTKTEQVWCQREQENLGRNKSNGRASRRIIESMHYNRRITLRRCSADVRVAFAVRINRHAGIHVARKLSPPFMDRQATLTWFNRSPYPTDSSLRQPAT